MNQATTSSFGELLVTSFARSCVQTNRGEVTTKKLSRSISSFNGTFASATMIVLTLFVWLKESYGQTEQEVWMAMEPFSEGNVSIDGGNLPK